MGVGVLRNKQNSFIILCRDVFLNSTRDQWSNGSTQGPSLHEHHEDLQSPRTLMMMMGHSMLIMLTTLMRINHHRWWKPWENLSIVEEDRFACRSSYSWRPWWKPNSSTTSKEDEIADDQDENISSSSQSVQLQQPLAAWLWLSPEILKYLHIEMMKYLNI